MKNAIIHNKLIIILTILMTIIFVMPVYAEGITGEGFFTLEKYGLGASKLYSDKMNLLESCIKNKKDFKADAYRIADIKGMSGSTINGSWDSEFAGVNYYIEASDMETKLSRDDLSSTFQSKTVSVYSVDDKCAMYYGKQMVDGKLSEQFIISKDGKITVTQNNDGKIVNNEYTGLTLDFNIPERLVKKLKSPKSIKWLSFDDNKMIFDENTGDLTQTEEGFVFSTTDSTGSKTKWFYDKNMVGTKFSSAGIDIVRCSVETAIKDRQKEVKDYVVTNWNSDCVLPRINEMNYLKLKVRAKSDEVRLVSNQRQSVSRVSKDSYDLIVINRPEKQSDDKVMDLSQYLDNEEIKKALKPEKLFESDSPEIKAQAQQIIGNEKDIYMQAMKLAGWVDNNIMATYEVGVGSALDTLKSRKGDCSESSALFIAMARSVGIPTKQVTGLKTLGSGYEAHAWAEIFAGKWIEIDPSTGGLPNVGYIRYDEGSYDFLPGTIEILEFGYGDEKVIVDKQRPCWNFDGSIYNNRIWGISFKVPKGFNFGVTGEKQYINIPRSGKVPPENETNTLFALQVDENLADRGILGMVITVDSKSSDGIFNSVASDGRINGIQYGAHGIIKQNEKNYLVYEMDIDSKMKAVVYQLQVKSGLYVDCLCMGDNLKEKYWDKLPDSVLELFESIKTENADIGKVVGNEIKVYVKDKQLAFDVDPFIDNDRVLVPMRIIFQEIGANISWDETSKTVKAVQDGNSIVVCIDKNEALVNDKNIKLDVPAKIISGRTFVPLRFVSENLGLSVKWDGKTREIKIQ